MRCASRAMATGGRLARAFATAVMLAGAASSSAHAQRPPEPTPTPIPTPSPGIISSDLSAGQAASDLGSNFLERLGGQATNGTNRMARTNPGGGGASEAAAAQQFRVWGEAYGIAARSEAQGDFVGDRRTTSGGVAGFGAMLAPGFNVGFSVDRSRSKIDIPLAFQSATLDLTQFGANFSIDKGPWTVAGAFVHGVGQLNSSRDTGASFAFANYNAVIDGVLAELDYYWMRDQSRIVPKIAFEYVRAATDAFSETGMSFFLVSASRASAERTRILAGAEIGHYWIFDRKILDLSAYGKFIDNVQQNFGTVVVSIPGFQSISVQGIGESRYGADAGAAASLSLTNNFRLYAHYDGKFRAAYQSHQGTVGLEARW